MKVIALGLLLGAAVVAVSAHVPFTMLSQQPIPACPPKAPNCNLGTIR